MRRPGTADPPEFRERLLSSGEGIISGLRVRSLKRSFIQKTVNMEIRKLHPGPYEPLTIDYIRTGADSVLVLCFSREVLEMKGSGAFSPRFRICLPPPGEFREVLLSGALKERISRAPDGFCTCELLPVEEEGNRSLSVPGASDLRLVFRHPAGKVLPESFRGFRLFLFLFILVLLFPWMPFPVRSRQEPDPAFFPESVNRTNQAGNRQQEEFLLDTALYETLLAAEYPRGFRFLSALSEYTGGRSGVESFSLKENRFQMSLWTAEPDLMTQYLLSVPGISGLETSGRGDRQGLTRLTVTGNYDE